jgi:hypothetical protein
MQVRVHLKKPILVQVLLLASFLGAFGFMDFYSALHVTEGSILCVVVLFSWLAFSTRMDSRGLLLNVLSVFGLVLFVLFYALVFAVRTDAPLLPSVLAQRYYIFFLIAPVTYMLYRSGWRLADFRRVFVLAAVLAMTSRAIVDLFPPSSASAPSPYVAPPREFLIFKQDTAYEGSSSLLRRLDASALFSALYFGRGLFSSKGFISFGFNLAVTVLSVSLLMVNAPRTLVAAALLSVLLYGVVLSRPVRAKLFIVLLPLLISAIAMYAAQLGNLVSTLFGGDLSYSTRVNSTQIAWEVVSQYPLFGIGQESAQSITYQDLFGAHFYPTDVGLLGVAFQWGAVGLVLYVFFSVWLVVKLLKLLWAYTGDASKTASRERLFLWALFILCLTFALTSPVQARFVKTEGLTIAAFAVGLIASHRHTLRSKHRGVPRPGPEPAANLRVARHV